MDPKSEELRRLAEAMEMLTKAQAISAQVIDELFRLLALHLSSEDLGSLMVNNKIKEAADLLAKASGSEK